MNQSIQTPARYLTWFASAATVYDETDRAVTALALVALTDLQRYKDLGVPVAAVGLVALSDAERYKDLGLVVPVSALVSATSTEHFRDVGLAVSVAAVVTDLEAQRYRETGIPLSAAAQVAGTDLQKWQDVGLSLTVQGIVSLASEVFHAGGTHYPETGLAVVIAGSATVSDFQRYLEASLPVAAQAVLSLALERGHYADAVQVLAAATLTATDVEHWRENLQALATGTVALSDAQRYREVGLLVQAIATLGVTDALRQARPGVPLFVFSTAPWVHSAWWGPVEWTEVVGCLVQPDGSLLKVIPSGFAAGARSVRSITADGGFIRWRLWDVDVVVGLGAGSTDQTLADVDYAVHPASGSQLKLYRLGSLVFQTTWSQGSIVEMSLSGGHIEVRVDLALVHTFAASVSPPLNVDTAMSGPSGSSVRPVTLLDAGDIEVVPRSFKTVSWARSGATPSWQRAFGG